MNINERGVIQKEIGIFTSSVKKLGPNKKFNTMKGEIIGQYNG